MKNAWLLTIATTMLSVGTYHSDAQCQFAVIHSNNDDHCLNAIEDGVWSKTGLSAGLTITNSDLAKTGASDGWNTGAISVNSVKNNGWATTTINETNRARYFGLSATDANVDPSSIQYGFYLRADAQLEIYESGNPKINLGAYVTGKVLKIAVEDNVVKYYYDNVLKYISIPAPVLPLIIDVSLFHVGASIEGIVVSNGSDGTFSVDVPAGDAGAGPTYQWYLNGGLIPGETGSTYVNPALTTGDQLYCELTPGATGCSGAPVNSNLVNFQVAPASSIGNFLITNVPANEACLVAKEEVMEFSMVNAALSGNDLLKNYGLASGSWDAGAFSVAEVLNNGSVESTVAETNKARAFGLSSSDGGLHLNTIQFGFYLRADGLVEIYESGSSKYSTSYSGTQVLKIAVEQGVVKYYQGATLLYISSVIPTLPLHVDISFQDIQATVQNVMISNGSTANFNAIASLTGPSPSYQWTVNGTGAGTNSSNYTDPSLADTDQVQCTIIPDLVGCTVTTPVISLSQRPYGGTFYISSTPSTIACASTEEQIQPANLINVTATNNNLRKVQGNNGFWNAGATSLNQILDNGYAETTIVETDKTRIFGISSNGRALTQSSVADNTIQYGIAFYSNSHYWVYELSADGSTYFSRGDFGSYSSGDVFKIKIDNGIVRYYKGSTNFYTSSITPNPPMVVDVSFNDVNATLNNIVVSNGSSGVFAAVANNAGPSPAYQWKVDGANVGSGIATYADANLTIGNVISCTLTPDIAGCNTGQDSNIITVDVIGGAASPTSTWTGTTSSVWENSSNWSNGIPTGFVKVSIPAGTPNNPVLASAKGVYDLTIQSGAAISITGTNTLTIFNTWDNQGSFTANNSTVYLKNCTNNSNTMTVSASGNSFYNLDVNNANDISMSGEHTILNNLSLTDGVLTASSASDKIVLVDNATVTGGSVNSHVAGKMKKIGDEAFSFPVGKSGRYRPLSIAAPAQVTDAFEAEYFSTGQTSGGPSTWESGLWTISGCEYWNLLRTAGTSTVAVTLSWVSADCDETDGPYVGDPSQLVVVGFNGTAWKNLSNTAFSGTTSGTVTSGASIASYAGPFSIGSLDDSNVLPIELIDFSLVQNAYGVALTWKTASELNSDYFGVERAGADGTFYQLKKVEAIGQSNQIQDYQFIDIQPLSGKSYYRLRQVDLNGYIEYSKVLLAEIDHRGLEVFPNPVKAGEVFFVNSTGEQFWIKDMITNRHIGNFKKGAVINSDLLKSGIYLLTDEAGNYTRLIVK